MSFRDDFPPVKDVRDMQSQLNVIRRELHEAQKEFVFCDDRNLAIELVDVIHATYNALYLMRLDDTQIQTLVDKVREKNRVRGYYK